MSEDYIKKLLEETAYHLVLANEPDLILLIELLFRLGEMPRDVSRYVRRVLGSRYTLDLVDCAVEYTYKNRLLEEMGKIKGEENDGC